MWKTEEPIYLVARRDDDGASLGRYVAIRRVDPDSIVGYETALRWERYYIVAGTIQGFWRRAFRLR